MNAFIALCKVETMLQWRSGFFLTAVVITAVWSAIVYFIPKDSVHTALGLILSLDISSIALLSCIGLHLLERRQNVVSALLITPINIFYKLLARVLIVSFLSSTISLFIAFPYVSFTYLIGLSFICFLNSLLYSVVGLLLALYATNISHLIVRLGLVTPLWLLPYLTYLQVYSHSLITLLPTYGITQMFSFLDTTAPFYYSYFFSWLLWFIFFSVWLLKKYRVVSTK